MARNSVFEIDLALDPPEATVDDTMRKTETALYLNEPSGLWGFKLFTYTSPEGHSIVDCYAVAGQYYYSVHTLDMFGDKLDIQLTMASENLSSGSTAQSDVEWFIDGTSVLHRDGSHPDGYALFKDDKFWTGKDYDINYGLGTPVLEPQHVAQIYHGYATYHTDTNAYISNIRYDMEGWDVMTEPFDTLDTAKWIANGGPDAGSAQYDTLPAPTISSGELIWNPADNSDYYHGSLIHDLWWHGSPQYNTIIDLELQSSPSAPTGSKAVLWWTPDCLHHIITQRVGGVVYLLSSTNGKEWNSPVTISITLTLVAALYDEMRGRVLVMMHDSSNAYRSEGTFDNDGVVTFSTAATVTVPSGGVPTGQGDMYWANNAAQLVVRTAGGVKHFTSVDFGKTWT